MKTEKQDNEYLVGDLVDSNIIESKTIFPKNKNIIILGISLFLIAIIAVVFFLLLIHNSNNNDKDNKEENPIEILPPLIINPVKEYTHCIIWLHGLNGQAENFEDLFKTEVPFIKRENTKIILMQAPYQIMSFNGENLTSWFDLYSFPVNNSECYNFTDAKKSRKMIEILIKEEAKKLNGNYQKIFIGGFSQGSVMSLYTGYNFNELLGGVLACSGNLLKETEIIGDKSKLKVFLAHGKLDKIVPFSFHKETVKRIENFEGVKKYYYEELEHALSDYEKIDMSGFLNDSMI